MILDTMLLNLRYLLRINLSFKDPVAGILLRSVDPTDINSCFNPKQIFH